MRQLVLATTVATALLIGGCASNQAGGPAASSTTTTSTTTSTAEAAPRLAAPVAIPATAARSLVVAMTGAKQVVEAKDWGDFKREWRDTFADHAKAANIDFRFVEGELPAKAPDADGTVLRVNVADYRMVGIGARIMFGIMTGNAFIDAKLSYTNQRDGALLGEQQFNTTSSALSGVFAKVTPQQVDSIATEVFANLKAAK